MAILKCKMCGGTLDYDREQDMAVCPYCGTKSVLLGQDRKLFQQFRDQFAALLNQESEKLPEEGFWVEAEREELVRSDGEIIEISYLAKRRADMCTLYVARHHIIYLFEKRDAGYAVRYLDMVKRLIYPSPEMKRELERYVPRPATDCLLADGRYFLAIEKPEGVYPLKMLGRLIDRHVAWILSRLENLCCLLEYNDMVLNAFTLENLFVDPGSHQIYLYGGWWFAGFRGSEIAGVSESVKPYLEARSIWHSSARKKVYAFRTDLESIRLVAAKLLGCPRREDVRTAQAVPEPFRRFLLQEPEKSSRADFAKWDKALLESYGERKFIPLAVAEEEIYMRS